MTELVELLVWDYGEAVATALGLALVLSITRIVRAGRARRRHDAVPHDPTVRIPVRLRGGDPAP